MTTQKEAMLDDEELAMEFSKKAEILMQKHTGSLLVAVEDFISKTRNTALEEARLNRIRK